MTTNTKYITRMFPLILLVCAASVFAMEEKTENKYDAIRKKYNTYGETFLLKTKWNTECIKIESLEVNKQNLKRSAEQFLIANKSLIGKSNQESQYFKSFAVFTEAVRDIKKNIGYTIPIIEGLGITPNAAVSESNLSTTKSISSMGTSFLGCVVRLIVENGKKINGGMKILEDLLKRGGNPDELKFYKNSYFKHLVSFNKKYFFDGQYMVYGPKESFFTPQQILNKFKKQQGLSMNQNKTIEDIDNLFAKTRGQLALESVNNQ